jgi:mRNA interferase YafQ
MMSSQTRYDIAFTNRYRKEYRKIIKSGRWTKAKDKELKECIRKLANKETLEAKYLDHALTNYSDGDREFHFRPDLLVVYSYVEEHLVISFGRIGSHSDLFK